MKLLHSGIHKRVGFIVQHSGGYDKEYHIIKVAAELNLNKDIVDRLFKEASKSNLLHYLELLEIGVPVDTVFKLVDHDNRMITAKIRSTFEIMESVINKSNYHY